MTVKIIIDSTCDLPDWIIEKFDIKILPLIVTIADQDFRDGVDIQLDEVYKTMRKGFVPKTSQVSPESIHSLFTEYCELGYDFIYVSFSSKLSGTHNLATMIANEIKEKYPDRQIAVIDSKAGSMATGLIVLQACLLIENGASFDEVYHYIIDAANHIEHIFTISDLDWLSKGGRIPKPIGKVGDLLSIKPLLNVEDGKMNVVQMVRGRKKALRTILQKVTQRIGDFTNQYIGIAHADDVETAKELEQMIKASFPESRTFIHSIGAVLGTHLGIGGVGVFFFNKKTEPYYYLD